MVKILAISPLLLLMACATPETVLKDNNGNVMTCGGGSTGSVLGGMIGYSIQKSNDDKCVKDHMSQGYKPVKIGDIEMEQSKN